MDNNINQTLPTTKTEDNIVGMKPQAIKMDILLFKNEVLHEIKQMEKSISEKNKESSEMIKTQVQVFDKKMNFINEKISSLTNKIIGGIKIEEKINTLFSAREKLLDETTSNRIKISFLEKEFRDSINRIDDIIKGSILYPGVIGIKGKFSNFHGFIDFVLSESNINNNFREKNIMDLSSYKLKIEKALQTLGFKVENILSSCNSFTLSKIKESQEKFDNSFGQYKEKLNEVRIENSNYVIQLEKDTKDLRDETNIVKSMKTDIFSKVDNDVLNMKKDNMNIIETFNTYKEDFKKINEDIKKLEKNIENLILQKIKVLFEEQKQINENMIKLKEEYDDFLNNKIKNIINEQMKNFIKDNNVKEVNNMTNNTTLYRNGANSVENIKENNSILNIKNSRKLTVFKNKDNKNNSSKNLLNNKDLLNNKQSLFIFSKNTSSLHSPQNINGNEIEKKISRNKSHGKTIHYDIITKKEIIDNLNKNKANYGNLLNINKINDNILLNIKNDNILIAKKSQFPISKQGQKNRSLISDTRQKVSGYFEPYGNKYTIVSRNMKKYRIKNKSEDNHDNDNDNDLDFNDYIKIFNFKSKNSLKRRRSYDKSKNENLEKFQKLLKMDINDVDAKLNNLNNSSSSFELLNEGQEIYDRFVDANIIIKNNNSKNGQNNNEKNNININFTKLNILSKPIKIINNNDNDINEFGKNLIASKTSSDINIFDSIKKDKSDYEANPINIKNKNIFQTSKKDKHKEIHIKKTNSDKLNLSKNFKNKTQNGFHPKIKKNHGFKPMDDSNNDFHNYFIGFDLENSEKKIKKGKKK